MSVTIASIEFWSDWPYSRDEDFDVRAVSTQSWVTAESEFVPANVSRVVGTGSITALRPTIPQIELPATSAGIDNQDARWTVTLHRTSKVDPLFTVLDNFPLNIGFEPVATWGEIGLFKNNGNNILWRDTEGFSRTDALSLINSRLLATLVNASDVVKGNTKLSVAPVSASNPIAAGANEPLLVTTAAPGLPNAQNLGALSTGLAYLSNDGSGTATVQAVTPGTANQILGMPSGVGGPEFKSLVAGDGVSIEHAAGSVTISAPGVYVNVKSNGATGDGTTDDTAAIQAVITAVAALGGGVVFFPRGTYKVTALTVASDYVRLVGEGRASRIAKSTATGNTLTFDNGLTGSALNTYLYGCGIENVCFEPSVPRTSGWEVYAPHFSGLALNQLTMISVYGGALIGRAADLNVDAHISNLRIYGMFIGLKLINALDAFVIGEVIDHANSAANAVGIWVSGGCENFSVSHGDNVNSSTTPGANSKTLWVYNDAGTATPARVCRFTDVDFDGGAYGAVIQDGKNSEFKGCWFHGWTDAGLVITGDAEDTKVFGGIAEACGTIGVYVNTTGRGTVLDVVTAANNGQLGMSSAFYLDTGAQDVTMRDCRTYRGSGWHTPSGLGTQNYGLTMAAGVHGCTVEGNRLLENTADAWNILSTDKTNVFRNNTTPHGVGDAVTVWRNSNQSVSNATQTDILFNTDLSDPNNMHDEVTPGAELYAWAPGWYTVTATIQFATNATGYRQVTFVRSDGTTFGMQQNWAPSASAPTVVNASASVYLTAGQSVKVQAYQTSGGSLNVESASQYAPSGSLVKQ